MALMSRADVTQSPKLRFSLFLTVKPTVEPSIIFFGGHKSFLCVHWYPCFGLLLMSPLVFKARVGSLIIINLTSYQSKHDTD